MGNANHDWFKISREYIEGYREADGSTRYPTTEELAEKYNIRPSHMRSHSANERWLDKREAFKRKVANLVEHNRARARAKEIETFMGDCLKVSKGGLWPLQKSLEHIIKRTNTAGDLSKEDLTKLEQLSRTLERLQKTGHLALGIPQTMMQISGLADQTHEISTTNLSPEERKRKLELIERRAKALKDDLSGGSLQRS